MFPIRKCCTSIVAKLSNYTCQLRVTDPDEFIENVKKRFLLVRNLVGLDKCNYANTNSSWKKCAMI